MSIYLPPDKREGLIPLIDGLIAEYQPLVPQILESSQVERVSLIGKLLEPIHRFMISTRKGRYGPDKKHDKWVPAFRRDGLSDAELALHDELRARTEAGDQVGGQAAFCIFRFLATILDLGGGSERFKRHQLAEELLAGFGADSGFYAGICAQVRHELTSRFLQPYREEKRAEFGDLLD